MKRKFLAETPSASTPNRIRVAKCITHGLGLERIGVERRHDLLKFLGRTNIKRSRLEAGPVDDWQSLAQETDDWIRRHLDGRRFPESTRENWKVMDNAHEGVQTIKAFLEVIPKVVFREDFEDPNTQIAQYASRSIGFIQEWAGVYRDVDAELAYALSAKKPPEIDKVFSNLTFNPNKFGYDTSDMTVFLNPLRSKNLRGSDNLTHPVQNQPDTAELWPCPAFQVIPHLYLQMVEQATQRGLFGATYQVERTNYGYDSLAS